MFKLHPILTFALGGFFVSVCSLVIWLHVNGEAQVFLSGEVSMISETVIAIQNRQGEETEFVIDESTVIVRRRDELSEPSIKVHDFVHVTGSKNIDGTYHAETVRFLRPPTKPSP